LLTNKATAVPRQLKTDIPEIFKDWLLLSKYNFVLFFLRLWIVNQQKTSNLTGF